MTPFAIAGIQMPISAAEENLGAMGRRLDLLMARYPWVQMAVFSELAAFGPLPQYAQALPGPAEASFQAMAARHGIWLLPGSLYEKKGGRIYNTAPVIDPRGAVVARYRKIFPFRPYEEATTPGADFVVFDVPEVGRFGVSICYDMWFPETTRTLAAMGAEVILHPTLTDTLDRDVELAICRASAAQNQCFWIDVNGLEAGGVGRSLVVGPSGDVLHQAGSGEEVMPLEIDLDRVRRERDRGLHGLGQPLKSFRDSRLDYAVYGSGFDRSYLDSLGPLVLARRPAIEHRPMRRPAS
ncbi:MAG TPA: carbon-nitrogen hydrolase family protein [Candidatus Udaeobacter sp.]|nr:carbon-nitrogen hydrolase family protein [Candidatus Udaeobacter sp.]